MFAFISNLFQIQFWFDIEFTMVKTRMRWDSDVNQTLKFFFISTERHRNLDDTETQLQFVELQIYLLEMFIKRLKEKAKEAVVSANHEIFYSLINGCHYMIETLNEWAEQVVRFFNSFFYDFTEILTLWCCLGSGLQFVPLRTWVRSSKHLFLIKMLVIFPLSLRKQYETVRNVSRAS